MAGVDVWILPEELGRGFFRHAAFHVKRRATRDDLDEGNLMMCGCDFRRESAPRVEVVPLPRVERFTWNMPDVRMSNHPLT
jgi:hypothetical protein